MSAPKRGLGTRTRRAARRGARSPSRARSEVVREIPGRRHSPNPFQPRKHFDAGALDELKASIAEYGVLVPIIVRRRDEGYELIAGERRWRACAELQRPTIPAIVRASDDRETLEVAIVENLQRENLNPLEEAAGFAYLIDEYGFTQEEVARRLGKSRPAVANTLRLLGLSDAIKAMLFDGRLSAGHARALLAAPEREREALAASGRERGLDACAAWSGSSAAGRRRRRSARRCCVRSRPTSAISNRGCARSSGRTSPSCATAAADASSCASATKPS